MRAENNETTVESAAIDAMDLVGTIGGTDNLPTYQLTFDVNTDDDVELAETSRTVTDGEAYGTLPTSVREGYIFDGWYSAAEGGNTVTAETICSGDATIYAHWTKDTCIARGHIDNDTETGIDWAIDADGKLTITGTGEFIIYDSDSDEAKVDRPWINFADQILSAEVDLSGTTNANEMFKGCVNLKNVDLSKFDTSMLEVTYGMFYNCSSLTRVDMSAFPLTKVTVAHNMFRACESLEYVDLSSMDLGDAEEGDENLFSGCNSLKTIKTYINYSEPVALPVIPMHDAKGNQYLEIPAGLTESITLEKGNPEDILPVQGHVDNQTEGGVDWRIQKVDGKNKLTVEGTGEFLLYDGKVIDVEKALDRDGDGYESNPETPWKLYASIIECAEIDLKDTVVADTMFYGCRSLTNADLSGFDMSALKSMHGMFMNCNVLSDIRWGAVNTENVLDMSGMFSGCGNLKNLDVLSSFDTAKVVDMHDMFYRCQKLESLDLSTFDTKNVTNMYRMFSGCSNLKDLNVSTFDTGNVTDMWQMFYGCESIENLDISNFNTVKVEDIGEMFYGCKKLRVLDISGFQTNLLFEHVFEGCDNLQMLRCFALSGDNVVWFVRYLPHKPMYDAAGRVYSWDERADEISAGTWLYTDRTLIGTVPVKAELAASPKTEYFVDEKLDVTGGELVITYDDGSTSKIALTEDMISGFDTSVAGTVRITVTYKGLKTVYSITVTELQQFTLTFDANGGNLSEAASKTITANTAYGTLPTPVREGYRFDGWYTAAEGGNAVTAETICSGNATIYAHWTKETVSVESVSIKAGITELKPGETLQLGAVINPENASNKNVTWSSDNKEVATIDAKGLVTAVSAGSVTITVTTEDGNKTATCRLNVMSEAETVIDVEYVSIKGETTALNPGETLQLAAVINPENARNHNVTWSSSNEAVATIDANGLVTAVANGETLITVIAEDRGTDNRIKKAELKLTVFDKNAALFAELAEGKEYVYTGTKITPAVNVFYGGELLKEGVDYTLSYSNNVNASEEGAKVVVNGKTIDGSATLKFTIKSKDLNSSDISEGTIMIPSGSKAVPVLYLGNYKLTAKDFSNPAASKKFNEDGTIELTGKGNFFGSRVVQVKVVANKKDLKKIKVSFTPGKKYYNNAEQYIDFDELDVTDMDGQPLNEGEDYTIAYSQDVKNAGTVKFTVIGMGVYTGTVTKSYKILPAQLAESDFDLDVESVIDYKAGGCTPDIEISCFGESLVAGRDYKVSFSNYKKIGTGKYSITFMGNYKGSAKITGEFEVEQASIEDAVVEAQNMVFSKAGKYLSVPYVSIDGVSLTKKDYSVTYYVDDEEITSKTKITEKDLTNGELWVDVVVTGKGNYSDETSATTRYCIIQVPAEQDLSKAKVVIRQKKNGKKVSSFVYTGGEITIDADDPDYEFYVTVGKGKDIVELKQNVDFTVSYVNNVHKGKATVILTGMGDQGTGKVEYYGSKVTTFKIVKGTLKTL